MASFLGSCLFLHVRVVLRGVLINQLLSVFVFLTGQLHLDHLG